MCLEGRIIDTNYHVEMILDTGSPIHSFINAQLAERIVEMGKGVVSSCNKQGILGNGQRWGVDSRIVIPVEITEETNKRIIHLDALIYRDLPVDIIVGAKDIANHNLKNILNGLIDEIAQCSDETSELLFMAEDETREDEELAAFPDDNDKDIAEIAIHGPDKLQRRLREIILENKELVTTKIHESSIGNCEFEIELYEEVSTNPKYINRRQSQEYLDRLEGIVQKLFDEGIIEESDGEFLQPTLLTAKKSGEPRFCIDFRILNRLTRPIQFPIPDIPLLIRRLGGYEYYGVVDLKAGYHQILLSQRSRKFTAFVCGRKTYQFRRVPFGLKNAGPFFQRVIHKILEGLVGTICECYIDDIIIFAKNEEEFADRVDKVFKRLKKHGVIIKPSKCRLGLSEIEFLGYRINKHGYSMTEEKMNTMRNMRQPNTVTELRSFLGLLNCFREFVKDLSQIMTPLMQLTVNKKKHQTLQWDEEAHQAFARAKEVAATAHTLHFIKPEGQLILFTDASEAGCGAVLMQEQNNQLVPIAFVSKAFNAVQKRWPVGEMEMYAIVFAIDKLHYLVANRPIIVRSDHRNNTFPKIKDGSKKVARWKLMLEQYDITYEYIHGETNESADALSRLFSMGTSHRKTVEEIDALIAKYHNDEAGHHGILKTVKRLKQENFKWTNMNYDVQTFIRNCVVCQKQREGNGMVGEHFSNVTQRRLETRCCRFRL